MNKSHSVQLKDDKCEGCTNCVQNCPTKAIRVHQGQAWIKEEYCIDCGECIRSCEHHAKYAITDDLELVDYKYTVAVVPPSFYGQFTKEINPGQVIAGLQELGFSEVWDAALGAEALTQATKDYLTDHEGPILSSACPAVIRLVQLLYPELLDYFLPFKSPVELVAQQLRERIEAERGLTREEVGIFFITPCPAKMTAIKNPLGMEESFFTGAIAVDKIYRPLLQQITEMEGSTQENYSFPQLGIGWANTGGESSLLSTEDTISVAGIHNVISVLEELARDDLSQIKFFELLACEPGCVGGVLNISNPFLAKFNIKQLVSQEAEFITQDVTDYQFALNNQFQSNAVDPLDEDFDSAIAKLSKLETEIEALPGLDCAACGAPDCETLAEDIIAGLASQCDCVFILRQQLADLTDKMAGLANSLPPVMQKEETDET
ncbi:[Fe-Fe] hydrogenase large subunit C-terminal domain-containing protein [Halanaerobaculum tunisiense]